MGKHEPERGLLACIDQISDQKEMFGEFFIAAHRKSPAVDSNQGVDFLPEARRIEIRVESNQISSQLPKHSRESVKNKKTTVHSVGRRSIFAIETSVCPECDSQLSNCK
jgi:hypothetical protein